MTSIEVIRRAHTEGAQLFRRREAEGVQYDCKPIFTGSKRGWILLDSFTASAVMACYNALNEENRARAERASIPKLVDFAWKHIKVGG